MSEPARPKRRYDASRRREQAVQTRTRIIDAAGRVFLERGFAGATIPTIAAQAGVAVETVYRSASGKAGLLAAAVQAALAGGAERAERPVEQREGIRRVLDETDPRRQLAAYAATHPDVRMIDGAFMQIQQAMGTPKGRLEGAAYLRTFIEEMKASGFVADAIKRSNQQAAVAPPAAK